MCPFPVQTSARRNGSLCEVAESCGFCDEPEAGRSGLDGIWTAPISTCSSTPLIIEDEEENVVENGCAQNEPRRNESRQNGPAQEGACESGGAATVLVTGFEPFGGASYNPTEAAVRMLAADYASHYPRLIVEILPVEFAAATARIRELIAAYRPTVTLCCGLNASSEVPVLERVARNRINARIADNAGVQPVGEAVQSGAPGTLRATLPIGRMLEAARSSGYEIGVSDDAGGFVCNATLFSALDALRQINDKRCCAGFLHLPDDVARSRVSNDAELIDVLVGAATE
ncbi:hypothetical protein DDD63_02105 [Actinobaculum sp. 313]|nr:hypothetical protein DDD63_02105 [Actinobaculum sp. 313]